MARAHSFQALACLEKMQATVLESSVMHMDQLASVSLLQAKKTSVFERMVGALVLLRQT
jgi:hypothetical protein